MKITRIAAKVWHRGRLKAFGVRRVISDNAHSEERARIYWFVTLFGRSWTIEFA